jgi:hypothetical protein
MPTEAELKRLVKDNKFMYERYRARVKQGEKELGQVKNREEKERKTYQLKTMMDKAKQYKDKIK